MNRAPTDTPRSARFGAVLWPAFLGAALADAVLFTLIDPVHVSWLDDRLHVSPVIAYTVGFFAFWLLIAGSSWVTLWLSTCPRPQAPTSASRRE
jgi:hypothetical protein